MIFNFNSKYPFVFKIDAIKNKYSDEWVTDSQNPTKHYPVKFSFDTPDLATQYQIKELKSKLLKCENQVEIIKLQLNKKEGAK